MVLPPVHAGHRDEDRHGDGREQEQPPPPATRVPDDQDRDRHVEAAGGGLVPGREGRGRQVLVQVRDVGPGPFDDRGGGEERGEFAQHQDGDVADLPPVPGQREEDHAGGEGHDEDGLGRAEDAEDLAPAVQGGRAVGREPVRDRPVTQHIAVPGLGDQFADADNSAEDQHPRHHEPGGDLGVQAEPSGSRGALRLGRGEVGPRLRFQSFGYRVGHRLACGAPGQLEGERGEAEPGDPEGPSAQHVGQVVDPQQDPADPDQGDKGHDDGDQRRTPAAAGGGQEDQEYRSVADNGAE